MATKLQVITKKKNKQSKSCCKAKSGSSVGVESKSGKFQLEFFFLNQCLTGIKKGKNKNKNLLNSCYNSTNTKRIRYDLWNKLIKTCSPTQTGSNGTSTFSNNFDPFQGCVTFTMHFKLFYEQLLQRKIQHNYIS